MVDVPFFDCIFFYSNILIKQGSQARFSSTQLRAVLGLRVLQVQEQPNRAGITQIPVQRVKYDPNTLIIELSYILF